MRGGRKGGARGHAHVARSVLCFSFHPPFVFGLHTLYTTLLSPQETMRAANWQRGLDAIAEVPARLRALTL